MASFGQYISQGLAQGITENEHLPLDAITSIADKMADAARDAVKSTQSILNSVNVASDLSHAAKVARKNRGTYDDYYSGPTKSLQIDYDGNQRINDKSTTINQTNNIYSPKALSPSEIAKEAAKQSMKLVLPLLR